MSLFPYTNVATAPAAIPAELKIALAFRGAQGGWWQLSDLSDLKQNSDGTGDVTAAGDPVGYVRDRSGNGNHMIQATPSARPTLRQDARGKYYLEMASGQGLYGANLVTVTIPLYILYAGRPGTSGVTRVYKASNKVLENKFLGDFRFTSSYDITGVGSGSRAGSLAETTWDVEVVSEAVFANLATKHALNGGDELVNTATTLTDAYTEAGYRYLVNMASMSSAASTEQDWYGAIIMHREPESEDRAVMAQHYREANGLAQLDGQDYDILGFGGQSNMQGQGDYLTSTPVTWGDAVEYALGYIRPLKDPTRHYSPPAGSVSNTGSLLPAFAAAYTAATGRKLCVVCGAASGIGITTGGWNPSPVYRDALAAKMVEAKALIEAAGGTATIRGIVFEGGENDAMNSIAKATVKTGVVTLRDNLRAALGAADPAGDYSAMPVFMMSIDRNTDSAKDAAFQAVREAISEACTENGGLDLVMSYQDFMGAGLLVDTIHWNQTALNTAGNLAGGATAALLP